MSIDLGDYKPVSERMAEFFAKHPNGSLRPLNPAEPYRIEEVGQQKFLIYSAVAYRTPDDPEPGVGMAWEPVPGKTPYTRDSELQNAETSAWGRAILAAGASDTKHGVASRDEVEARTAPPGMPDEVFAAVVVDAHKHGVTWRRLKELVLHVMDGDSDVLREVPPGDRLEELKSLIRREGVTAAREDAPLHHAESAAVPAGQEGAAVSVSSARAPQGESPDLLDAIKDREAER